MINRIGEIYTNNKGETMKVVCYNKASDVWVEFQDTYKAKVHTNMSSIRKGAVKNPYHPIVFEVGYLGQIDGFNYSPTQDEGMSRLYTCWSCMLMRCYDKGYQDRNPSYVGTVVDDRWHCFANFIEDAKFLDGYEHIINKNEDYVLDKDIKSKDIKVYSKDTCIFIPRSLNSSESRLRNGNAHRNIPVNATNKKTGEILFFNSLREGCKQLQINEGHACECCKGKRKSAGGYVWSYTYDKEEESYEI